MIFRFESAKEFSTPEGCHIVELLNSYKDEGCSIARARVEPGITTQLHALRNTTERYVILEGQGRVEVDGHDPTIVGPLDVVFISEGASQRITNTTGQDLIFLAVCTPRFRRECYDNLER